MEFKVQKEVLDSGVKIVFAAVDGMDFCGGSVVIDPRLFYTSPSPRDGLLSRMPSSAFKKKKKKEIFPYD